MLAAEAPRAERLEKPSRMVNGDIVSIVIKELETEGFNLAPTLSLTRRIGSL